MQHAHSNNHLQTDAHNNKTIESVNSRRSFLKKLSCSAAIASFGVPAVSNASLVNNNQLQNSYVGCYPANVSTRLFSCSNASTLAVKNQFALKRLACAGFSVANPEVLHRQYLRFGGTDVQRADDFNAVAQQRVNVPKLLLGVRGGYGAVRILERVNWSKLGQVMRDNGTILAGFSDVTAIQCALLAKGAMSSLNAPMAYSEFGKDVPDTVSCEGFFKALTTTNLTLQTYSAQKTSSNLPTVLTNKYQKVVSGQIWGGNLSVLSSLTGSQYLPNPSGGIVFIEEVGETPYRVERMLYDLYLAGAFKHQQAIVFGAMNRISSDGYDNSYNVATVIRELHRLTGLPIYSGVAFGHVGKKQSFPMGCHCDLTTTDYGFSMQFSGYPTLASRDINLAALSQPYSFT